MVPPSVPITHRPQASVISADAPPDTRRDKRLSLDMGIYIREMNELTPTVNLVTDFKVQICVTCLTTCWFKGSNNWMLYEYSHLASSFHSDEWEPFAPCFFRITWRTISIKLSLKLKKLLQGRVLGLPRGAHSCVDCKSSKVARDYRQETSLKVEEERAKAIIDRERMAVDNASEIVKGQLELACSCMQEEGPLFIGGLN
ncbi:hypothetical protein LOK49_LG06G00882 [Camellia lanceoleosa]|uniref:Uncharacterized protein n=1 Tax=Camellia lanceoleosa TaxID=1840588 RepID=A0ACC0HC06_9ERIC|nr:hypothetical protein LOK49_LG06G00882 [Camellia lanceoleosa]